MSTKTLWGAHLCMPGNKVETLRKLPILDVNNVVIDLEYGTKLPVKMEARYLTKNAISYIRNIRSDINICVKVNKSSVVQLQEEDIKVISQSCPDSIRIPSVNSFYEIERIDKILEECEKKNKLQVGSIKIHPMIETPKGLRNASDIIKSSSRVEAIAFGGEKWAYNCGLNRSQKGSELECVKFKITTLAAEHEIFSIDCEFPFLNDEKGLIKDCKNSRIIGFKARDTISPDQLELINTIYYPSEKECNWAMSFFSDLEEIKIEDRVNYIVNGTIVDHLSVYQARNIIEKMCEVKTDGVNEDKIKNMDMSLKVKKGVEI